MNCGSASSTYCPTIIRHIEDWSRTVRVDGYHATRSGDGRRMLYLSADTDGDIQIRSYRMPGLPHLHGSVHQPGFHCRRPGHRRTDTFGPLPISSAHLRVFTPRPIPIIIELSFSEVPPHFFRHGLQHANTAVGSSCLINMIDDFPPPRSILLPGFHHPGRTEAICGLQQGLTIVAIRFPPKAGRIWRNSRCPYPFPTPYICRQSGMQYSSQSCGQTTTAWRSP